MKNDLKTLNLKRLKRLLYFIVIICIFSLIANYMIYHVRINEIYGFYVIKPNNLNQYLYINPNGTYMHIYKCDDAEYVVDTNTWSYHRNSAETRVEFEDFRACLDDDGGVCISDLTNEHEGKIIVNMENDKSCKEKEEKRGDWPSLAYKTIGGKVRLVLRINKDYFFERVK